MLTQRMIEAFRAVILNGGVSSAARALNVSQPSVSRLISELEQEVSLNLFDREGNRLRPTDIGLELFAEVERSFVGLTRIRERAQSLRTRAARNLRIACLPAIALTVLPDAITTVSRMFPQIRLTIQIVASQTALHMVYAGQVDIAFSSILGSARSVTELGYWQSDCVVLLPPGHALGQCSAIGPAELSNEPMIALGSASATRDRTDLALQAVKPEIVCETSQSVSASLLVMQGLGLAITDPFAGARHRMAGGVTRPFHPAIPFEFWAYMSPTRTQDEAIQAIIAGMNEAIEAAVSS